MYLTTVVLESSTQTLQMSVEVRTKSTSVSWEHRGRGHCEAERTDNRSEEEKPDLSPAAWPALWRVRISDVDCSGCCRWPPAEAQWTGLAAAPPGKHIDRGQWWVRRPDAGGGPGRPDASRRCWLACAPACRPPGGRTAPAGSQVLVSSFCLFGQV